MELYEIVVSFIIIGFFIGSAILVKIVNQDTSKQEFKKDKSS
jgi:hypothetical protein